MPNKPPTYRQPSSQRTGRPRAARRKVRQAAAIRQSRRWTRFSVRLRQDYPICQSPAHDGPLAGVASVHHFEPLADRPDLAFDESNCWCLCAACHRQITDIERTQGIGAAKAVLVPGTGTRSESLGGGRLETR